jgi:hypothetical protein
MRVAMGLALIVVLVIGRNSSGDFLMRLAVVSGVLAIAMFLFHSLTVEVNSVRIQVAFGPGWIRWRLAVAEVVDAQRVRNRWYFGSGIRLTPHGWLYNVSGLHAVQVRMKSGKGFRIGTDDPDRLLDAIRVASALES